MEDTCLGGRGYLLLPVLLTTGLLAWGLPACTVGGMPVHS